MRKVYKDPKTLATALRDLVDFYLDGVITYEKLKEKINILIDANEERLYKNGNMSLKISNIIGNSGVAIINKVFTERQS
ncbi:TIGR04540 family protein [Clostridium sp.]|uniref:TIGR04540 family protein n=1 Tax=Clostridium sp. TaxID=1506 RepID=UPI003D6D82CB